MADEFLTIGVGVDSRQAAQGMQKFQKEVQKQLRKVTKAVETMGKANEKVSKKAAEDAEEWSDEVKNLTKYYQRETAEIEALQRALEDVERAQKKGGKGAKKEAQERAAALKKEIASRKKAFASKVDVGFDAGKMGDEAKDAMKDAGREFTSILSSFFSKDLKGMLAGGGGLAVGLSKGIAKGVASGSAKLSGMGTAMGRAGSARGGMAGAGMQGMGAALKGLGGLSKQLGPLINTLAKVGPLLGAIGTGVMAVIKLLVDAEAQAKEFQKGLLESVSTIEIMGDMGWDAGAAFAELKDTVRGIRDAAYDFSFNDAWGISADTHKAVVNSLNQEGVSLQRIREEAKAAGKDVAEFSKSLVGVSVAYSRAFGVPLQEINQLQAQMMTEMGQNAEEVELGFSQMARSAAESGIAANKFFAIIRGVSQDLSLYNVRMGEAVKMLKMLGKVMSPQNAQKFMQVATKGLKDMGRVERLKLTLLAGADKVGAVVDRDINRKTDLLSRKLKMDSAEVAKIMRTKGAKGLSEAISKLSPEAQGAVTEMATKLQLQMTRRKKGTFGVSGAAADVGPGAALEIMEAAVAKFSGGKKLEDAVGDLGTEMIAENLGISQEELDQRIQFKLAMDVQREKMIGLLGRQKDLQEKEARAKRGEIKLTEDEQADIERLKAMTDAGMTSADQIAKAGYDQLFDAMSEGDQQAAKDAGKVTDYAKMQTSLTQSLLERLGILIDFIMNQIYNVMVDMWDGIDKIVGRLLGGRKHMDIAAARSKNKDVMAAVERAGGDAYKFRNEIDKAPVFQDMLKALYITPDTIADKQKRIEELKAGAVSREPVQEEEEAAALGITREEMAQRKKFMKEEAARLEAELEADKKRSEAARAAVSTGAKGMSPELISASITDALGNVRTEEGYVKEQQLQNLIALGKPLMEAMQQAGYTAEEQGQIAGKLMHWQMDPTDMARAVGQYGQTSGYTDQEMVDAAKKTAEDAAKSAESGAKTANSTKVLSDEGTKNGTLYFKMPQTILRGEYKKTVKEAVEEGSLIAIRRALFEYYLYSDLDKKDVIKTMAQGNLDLGGFLDRISEEAIKGGNLPQDVFETLGGGGTAPGETPKPPGKQHGGVASGIGPDGLAIFRRPSGEGVTGIKPGERIVPAYAGPGAGGGGGGGEIKVSLAPDAQKLIQVEVQRGILEHERRRRTAG